MNPTLNRIRYSLVACLICLLMPGTILANDREPLGLVQELRYMSKQEVTLEGDSSFFVLRIGPSEAGTMQPDLADLRLFSDGYELGYAPIPLDNRNEAIQASPLELLNQGTTEDGKTSFVMAMPSYDNGRLKIKLNHDPYLVKGTLYGSQDNREWLTLRQITLFGIEDHYNEIPLNGLDYEYLKIEFSSSANEEISVNEAVLIRHVNPPANPSGEWMEAPITVTRNERESEIVVDLHESHRISSEWTIEVKDQTFYRQVMTEGSHDRQQWYLIGNSYIYRGGGAEDETVAFAYGPENYHYLRIRILDHDNEPLQIQNMEVMTHPVEILVKAPGTVQSFPLHAYWGNPDVRRPVYDVDEFISKVDFDQLYEANLVEPMENPDYDRDRDKVPFTERFPFILPAVLVVAVGVVAYVLFRNLGHMK